MKLPKPLFAPVKITTPSAGAQIGAPIREAISRPLCIVFAPVKGDILGPKFEVIQPFTGDTEGMVWVSNINVETTNSDGWCDAAMYFYVACSGTGNATSDPGDDVILDIGVEYY